MKVKRGLINCMFKFYFRFLQFSSLPSPERRLLQEDQLQESSVLAAGLSPMCLKPTSSPGVVVLISNLHCIHFFFEISFLISIFVAIWTIANFKSISKSRWEFWMKFQIEISNCKLLQILNLKLMISFIGQKGPN